MDKKSHNKEINMYIKRKHKAEDNVEGIIIDLNKSIKGMEGVTRIIQKSIHCQSSNSINRSEPYYP